MTTGTSLFNAMNTQAFSRLSTKIADLQHNISSGKNDPKASADPVRAVQLSAAKEHEAALERYTANATYARNRLDQGDLAIGEVGNLANRLNEIAIRAASESTPDFERRTLRNEVQQIHDHLLGLANSRDASGRALFGGFYTGADPFTVEGDDVVYQGNGGTHQLRVSESAELATGLDGGSVFGEIPTENGRMDLFKVVRNLEFALTLGAGSRDAAITHEGGMNFTPSLTREVAQWTMTVEGPSGAAEITADVAAGAPDVMVAAINAETASTGVTAALQADGRSITLTPVTPGNVTLSNLSTDTDRRAVLAQVFALDAGGQPTGVAGGIVAQAHTAGAQIDATEGAASHMAEQRGRIGSLGEVAKQHVETLAAREVRLKEALSGIEDLDISSAITELQQLLMNRDAAQQTYVRITQSSLFDYIR